VFGAVRGFADAGGVLRLPDVGDPVVPQQRIAFRFRKEDAGAFVIVEPHDVFVSPFHFVGIIQVVRVETDRSAQDLRPHFRPGVVNDFQAFVVERVEPAFVKRIRHGCRGVVIRIDIDVPDAVNSVVVERRFAFGGISGHVAFYDHRQVDRAVARRRVGYITDVVDREVVISPVFQE